MQIIYYRDPAGNFGDDLNGVLWRKLLPASVFDVEDVLLMGVGSIFNAYCAPASRTQGKRVFVLGSGAGYGPLPPDWHGWDLLAVRGPLTARLLGRPELAVTDSAALLSLVPNFIKPSPQRNQTLLIPHYHSAARGQWKSVAEQAGMTFLDPRWPVEVVMEHFSRASLVVTEAMHGAIVADTMRIPWIPITIAPDALPFKWWDWALSLDMAYKPMRMPPSSLWENLYHRILVREAKAQGLVPSALASDTQSAVSLVSDFHSRYKMASNPHQSREERPPAKKVRKLVRSACSMLDGFFIENAAKHLRKAVVEQSYLSSDNKLLCKVDQLRTLMARFVQSVNPALAY